MGQVVGLLEIALESIVDNGKLILDEIFMMGIFDELLRKVPPFVDYFKYIYQNRMTTSVDDTRKKVVTFAKLRDELFSPK